VDVELWCGSHGLDVDVDSKPFFMGWKFLENLTMK